MLSRPCSGITISDPLGLAPKVGLHFISSSSWFDHLDRKGPEIVFAVNMARAAETGRLMYINLGIKASFVRSSVGGVCVGQVAAAISSIGSAGDPRGGKVCENFLFCFV